VGGEGLPAAQARLTYRMGLRLLEDLTKALALPADPRCRVRLAEADLPALLAAAKASGLGLTFGPGATEELLRLVRRYDGYLITPAAWLLIPLPSWIPPAEAGQESEAANGPGGQGDRGSHP